LLDTIAVDSRDVFINAMRHWSNGDVTPRPRFQVHGAADEPRWFEASGNVEFDEDGKPRRLFGVSWDVTAQVAEECARKASDEQLAAIADLVPGVVYTFRRDPAGRYSMPYASSGIMDVFGIAPSAVRHDLGPIMALIHPDDATGLIASIEASAARLIRWQYECRFLRHDGSLHWLFGTAAPQRDADGTVRWHGHIIDVTERHQAQQQLRESQARLTLALTSARMSSWHWDLHTDLMKTTRALADMVGLNAVEMPSATVFDRVHPDDVTALRDCFDQATHADDDETFSVDYRFLWPDGDYRWVELRARAMRDEQGKVIAFDGVSSDITERRRAEVERERLQRQLSQAQKMEAIGLLTGGIAHDFNNILASVLGYSSLALQRFGTKNPPKLADYLAEVIKAGERARDLVAQMLAFSRGETTEVVQVDVAPLVDQIMKMLRPTLPSSIDIEIDLAAELPPIAANVVQIQQVLLNLCINARDAMVATGRIVIAARRQHFAPTECASCHKSFQGDYVVLAVTDDGMGIPEPQRSRIFEPFFTTKSNQKGTGMGLSTVHGIVHRHRGHIGLASTVAVGSTFSIALPLTCSDVATSSTTSRSAVEKPPSAIRAAHILVVDDEPSIAQCTAEMLELAGFTVEVETDSVKAEARLRSTPHDIDVLITDQTMPRLTGHQLALSALNERPDLPVLLVTGHSAMVNERQAHALGIRAFLRKPVPRDELLNAVNDALSEADARRA
jgi:PAS domain S-box-containing protein